MLFELGHCWLTCSNFRDLEYLKLFIQILVELTRIWAVDANLLDPGIKLPKFSNSSVKGTWMSKVCHREVKESVAFYSKCGVISWFLSKMVYEEVWFFSGEIDLHSLCCWCSAEAFTKQSWDSFLDLASMPPLEQTLSLYDELKALNWKFAVISERAEEQRNMTMKNLGDAGYEDFILVLR